VIPTDGEIIEGKAYVNSLYLTGQPITNEVSIGNTVYEGIIIVEGELKIKVSRVPEEYREAELSLKNLKVNSNLNRYENHIALISLGMATLNYLITGNILNAFSILLVLTPTASRTALNTGIKNYATVLKKQNIYLRNPECIESIINATGVVFDKTGTLTQGNMDIIRTDSFDDNYSLDELLVICSECEADSYHPVALSFKEATHGMNISSINKIENITKFPSKGLEAYYNEKRVLIGNITFLNENGVDTSKALDKLEEYQKMHCNAILVSINGKLTGDNSDTAIDVANKLLIDKNKIFSGYNYKEKKKFIEEHRNKGKIIMVGDGINDEGAMSAADVSISFSNSACDKLKLQSDCIIFENDMVKLADLILISDKSLRKINHSIAISQGYNLFFGALAFFQCFDAFAATTLNTINSLMVILLNERIRWSTPNKFHDKH